MLGAFGGAHVFTMTRTAGRISAAVHGACSFIPVYSACMATLERPVRQSVSLPPRVARRVKALAKTKKTSANRVIVDLIGAGLEAREREKKLFFDLADRLTRSSDAAEQKRLKEDLARMTFGG
jgi:hypothetical protein